MWVAFLMSHPPAKAETVATPNFWDQGQRFPEPNLSTRTRIRFLTSTDYPPFNFLDLRGQLIGLNVDLARAICDELAVSAICEIEARPFGALKAALEAGEGDAVIAGLGLTADNREDLAFTHSYFRYPARFVSRRDASLDTALATRLDGVAIGTVAGSAHDAMLRAFFPKAQATTFENRDAALAALREGKVAGVFGDGVGLSFWLASEAAADCCAFSGGPYLSEHFLGEGLAIAVPGDDRELARAFDAAIGRLVTKGRMSELLLRYFPISPF